MLDDDVILTGSSAQAKSILREIEAKSRFFHHYKFIQTPSDSAANVLCFNGRVIAPLSRKAECQHVPELAANPKVVWVDDDEFNKIDGSLTCRSVFFDDEN